jgi:hypothetical protein
MYQGCQMVSFQTKKSQFGKILEGLAMENLGIFYDHLVYLTAIKNILWPFGTFCGHLVHFVAIWYIFPILVFCTKTNLATLRMYTYPFLSKCFLYPITWQTRQRKYLTEKSKKKVF